MGNEKKNVWIRYIVCLVVGAGIIGCVFLLRGFYRDNAKQNIQLLHDAFFSAGALLMLFAGLLYVSGEGVFLGVGYVFGRAIKALIPFSRKEHETYAQYRERKIGKKSSKGDHCLLLTGLFYFLISLIFLAIWYQM